MRRARARYLALAPVVAVGWIAGCASSFQVEWSPPDCGPEDAGAHPTVEAPGAADGASEANTDEPVSEAAPVASMEAGADISISDATPIPDATQDDNRWQRRDATAPADARPIPPDARPVTCVDGIKDGDESDVDCGGSCAGCGPHKLCYVDFDCSETASGCETATGGCFCQYITHQCVFDHCLDGKISGDETDVDCGGSTCAPCLTGLACRQNSDCKSLACDGITFLCILNLCFDRKQDGMESDIDCGGINCGPCSTGRKCGSSFDCQSGHPCLPSHVCS